MVSKEKLKNENLLKVHVELMKRLYLNYILFNKD